jgi:small-conductance mechanosensitive channel
MDYTQWAETLSLSATRLVERGIAFLPNILTALALVLLGWILARILRSVCERITRLGLGRLTHSIAMRRGLESTGLATTAPMVIGRVIFWVVWLFFIAGALEKLELAVVRDFLSNLAYYLPRVLLGILVVFVGILAGNLANHALVTSTARGGVRYAQVVGRVVQGAILLVAIIVAADQIGIQSTLLMVTVAIILGTTMGGAALAFGLGSGPTVSNIIASYYLQKTYRVGQQVRIGDIRGRIVEINPTTVVLDGGGGRVLIPAKKFSEESSVLLTGEQA